MITKMQRLLSLRMMSKPDQTKRFVLVNDDEADAMCANLICLGGGGDGRNSVAIYGTPSKHSVLEHHYDAATGISSWYKRI
jgi:hypothetical protein